MNPSNNSYSLSSPGALIAQRRSPLGLLKAPALLMAKKQQHGMDTKILEMVLKTRVVSAINTVPLRLGMQTFNKSKSLRTHCCREFWKLFHVFSNGKWMK
jgi:hypothetical protein